MKIRFFIFGLTLFISISALGQMDYRVTSGIIAFNQEDYETALKDLDEALQNINEINTNNISQAFLFRGKAKTKLLFKATMENDKEAVALYQNALFEAWSDYTTALKYDNGRNENAINKEIEALYQPLLSSGLSMLKSVYNKTYADNEIYTVLQYANKCLKTALEIEKTYIAYDILAQIELNQQDSLLALENFKNALSLFKEDEFKKPDLFIGYIYYRIAIIESYHLNRIDTCILVLKEGQEALHLEYGKLEEGKDNYSKDEWQNLELQFHIIMNDLKNLELDTYLKTDVHSREVISKFEEALAENPNDYLLLVGYGHIIEPENTKEAIRIYKKAITINPKNDLAYYNLGVLYFNLGVVQDSKANSIGAQDSAAIFKNEARVYYTEALPYLQKAFEIDPYSLETIKALKQISLITNRNEDFRLYQEFENKIQNETGFEVD